MFCPLRDTFSYHITGYSPFHSSLPLSSFCVNQVTFSFYFRIETVSQSPDVLTVYSALILSLDNDYISSDKNIVSVWLKHIFISKFFTQHIQCNPTSAIRKRELYQKTRVAPIMKFIIYSKN